MNLTTIISRAKDRQALRIAQEKTAKEAAEREERTHTERIKSIFRDAVIPALESARSQLTAHGIECSLTNGEDPQTKAPRHDLMLEWEGSTHSITFTADGRQIRDTVLFAGGPRGMGMRDPFNGTLASAEALVADFVEKALSTEIPQGRL